MPEPRVEFVKDTLIPSKVCGRQIMTLMLPDWGELVYVSYSGKRELEKIRKALFQAEFNIVKVTSERVYFEV